jgi:hypothetical protein
MNESQERYPIEEAEQVIADRVGGGSSVLRLEGVWVEGDEERPDPDHAADLGPDGATDLHAISEAMRQWPRDDGFCVDIVFVRPGSQTRADR